MFTRIDRRSAAAGVAGNRSSHRRARQALLLSAVLAALPGRATAQVSPGSYHATVGDGAGLGPSVSPTGGFAAQVPLSLPPARGPIPIPLSVVYTGLTRAGAAGAGWDIPISYVAWQSPNRNRPMATAEHGERPPRLMLALDGAPQRMVQVDSSGNRFVPYLSPTYLELLKVGDSWHLKTLNNLEYTFRPYGTSGALWVLTDIQDLVGTDHVHIDYDTGPGLGSCGPDLHVTKLSYAYGANSKPLYEVELTYDGWWREDATSPGGTVCAERGDEYATRFDRSPDDMLNAGRSTIVTAIAIKARNNLDDTFEPKVIRSYDFQYAGDLDTNKPRLSSVVMHGEGGQGSETLASYDYGSLSSSSGWITFAKPRAVPRSPSLPAEYVDDVSASQESSTVLVGPGIFNNDRGRLEWTRSRHMIRDFTGDGVPDEVWKDGDRWHLSKGVVTSEGARLDGGESSWKEPAELFEQSTFRFLEPTVLAGAPHDLGIVSETWTQFLDWNGDGRLDVVDSRAGDGKDNWRVWINQDDGAGGVAWRSVDTVVASFRAFQETHALENIRSDVRARFSIDWSEHTPLGRTRSWPRGEPSTTPG